MAQRMNWSVWCSNHLYCNTTNQGKSTDDEVGQPCAEIDQEYPHEDNRCSTFGRLFCSKECHTAWHSRDHEPCADCGGDHHTEEC